MILFIQVNLVLMIGVYTLEMKNVHVSIVVLVYNALDYVRICLESLKKTKGVLYELIVVDNNSEPETSEFLREKFLNNEIDKFRSLDTNHYFSGGNNIGARLSSEKSTHLLLMNSDVEIRDELWMWKMVNRHERGITALGVLNERTKLERVDGWCLLIDRDIYLERLLDEKFPFYGSITKLQREVLNDGFSVVGIRNYEPLVYHFGEKSGKVPPEYKPNPREFDGLYSSWFARGGRIKIT